MRLPILVINTNLAPILHRFRDITLERSKIATFFYHCLVQPPDGGVPLGKISVKVYLDVRSPTY